MGEEIIGELESGLVFVLNPIWVKNWEEDEIKSFEENKDEEVVKKT